MTLQVTNRPTSFDDMIGNESVIESLRSVLKRPTPPSTFLFTGPSGTGKTTLARIVASELRCHANEFREINASDDTGIDSIRRLRDDMRLSPLSGDKKVILLDECFYENTNITTVFGKIPIGNMLPGNQVYNLSGVDTVECVLKTKVTLDRIIRINKSNGDHTFCSKDHLFKTDDNWIEAKDLTNFILLNYNSKHMINRHLLKEDKNAHFNLQTMQERISEQKENQDFLFKSLLRFIQRKIKKFKTKETIYNYLQILWKRISKKIKPFYFLLKKLFGKMENESTRISSKNTQQKCERENKKNSDFVQRYGSWKESCKNLFQNNDREQSNEKSKNYRENEICKKIKWYSEYLAFCSWWKWTIDRTSEIACNFLGMGNRDCYTVGETSNRISNELQSGYREYPFEDCNRSGWKRTQSERKNFSGSEERKQTERIRVESVEIYKPGSNDISFSSIISDKERNQGFVEFYDLQIRNNPSYIADGLMVHNCHMLSKNSQEALLKILEEPPSYVHIILATTNPEALKPTFKRRCHQYDLSPLSPHEIMVLIKKTLISEKKDIKKFPKSVAENIVEISDGSPGQSMKLLDMIIDMTDKDKMLDSLKNSGMTVAAKEVIDICRILISDMNGKTKWMRISAILKELKTDGENARRPILGYLEKVLLSKDLEQGEYIAGIMSNFSENYYNTGKAGLALSCYLSCMS